MILAHNFVGKEDAPHLAFLLHGVLGAGHNLRSLAKRLCELRPEYRIALVDLRCHGRSLDAPAPHTLEACVGDLVDLAEHLGRAPRAIIGHSLGGKVALAYGLHHERGEAPLPSDTSALRQIWTLDSDPGAQRPGDDHQVMRVLGALLANRGPFESRADAVSTLQSTGLSPGLSNWLATSLERKEEGLLWRFDLDAIGALLENYFSTDYWGDLEEIARGLEGNQQRRFDLLVAEASDRWSGSMRERAESLENHQRLHVHVLADAGHWVHVDNPDGLVEILGEHLIS